MNKFLTSQSVTSSHEYHFPIRRYIKNAADRFLAAIALVLLTVPFAILAILIKSDGGPAFYAQIRIGKNKKPFRCYKFRTMVPNANDVLEKILENDDEMRKEHTSTYKIKNDPRISKIGKILRQYSIDELPQLYNIVRGEMSFVGPRPIVREERKYYGEVFEEYISVKPGLTGLWQVSGRNDISYETRVQLDQWYVHNWSLWNDFVILLKTVYVVLSARGAY